MLLLSLMKETRYDAEVRFLQDAIIRSLDHDQEGVESFAESGAVLELSETHKRALAALEALKRMADEDLRAESSSQNVPRSPDSSAGDQNLTDPNDSSRPIVLADEGFYPGYEIFNLRSIDDD